MREWLLSEDIDLLANPEGIELFRPLDERAFRRLEHRLDCMRLGWTRARLDRWLQVWRVLHSLPLVGVAFSDVDEPLAMPEYTEPVLAWRAREHNERKRGRRRTDAERAVDRAERRQLAIQRARSAREERARRL